VHLENPRCTAAPSDRRTELAGEPLVWQVALENLVAELTTW
jgi:hypothetical protein